MNANFLYELGMVLSIVAAFFFLLIVPVLTDWKYYRLAKKIKIIILYTLIELLLIGVSIFCATKNNETYKEVYYLEYTIYWPGNKITYKVDSCNHIYNYSDRGSNYIKYYSIHKKDTYGVGTTAPILINKIIKK